MNNNMDDIAIDGNSESGASHGDVETLDSDTKRSYVKPEENEIIDQSSCRPKAYQKEKRKNPNGPRSKSKSPSSNGMGAYADIDSYTGSSEDFLEAQFLDEDEGSLHMHHVPHVHLDDPDVVVHGLKEKVTVYCASLLNPAAAGKPVKTGQFNAVGF